MIITKQILETLVQLFDHFQVDDTVEIRAEKDGIRLIAKDGTPVFLGSPNAGKSKHHGIGITGFETKPLDDRTTD